MDYERRWISNRNTVEELEQMHIEFELGKCKFLRQRPCHSLPLLMEFVERLFQMLPFVAPLVTE